MKSYQHAFVAGLLACTLSISTTFVQAEDVLHHEPTTIDGVYFRPNSHRIDLGTEIAIDIFHPNGVSAGVLDITYIRVLAEAAYRFAPNDRVEFSFGIPFMAQSFTYTGTQGSLLDDDTSAGIGQIHAAAKMPFKDHFAFKGFVELPTGDPDKTPSLGEGTNLGFKLIGEQPLGKMMAHFGIGHILKMEYTQGSVDRDPGNVTEIDLGATVQKNVSKGQMGASIELQHFLIGKAQVNGVDVPDSDGSATNLTFGLSMGRAQQDRETLVKLGFTFGIGEEDFQSFDIARGAGDILFFGSASFRWGRQS